MTTINYCQFEDKEMIDNANGQSNSEHKSEYISEYISEHNGADRTDRAEWNDTEAEWNGIWTELNEITPIKMVTKSPKK